MTPRILAIVGATASGKSSLALALAGAVGGEIVAADSVQVYRGLDIGSAKPSAAERQAVPHHLIDVCDPDTPFSVADYVAQADAAVAAIAARGRVPMVVGGTGLYVRALLRQYDFSGPGADPALRGRLTALAEQEGAAALHARLAAVDPAAAAATDPRNVRRVVRALEYYHLTGRPISARVPPGGPAARYQYVMVGLAWPRPELYRRIDLRVDQMLAAGWADEVRDLLRRGYSPYRGALTSLGYRELCAWLRGRNTHAEAVAWIQRNTRRYARRQLIWFRAEPQIHWVAADRALPAVVDAVMGLWSRAH